MYRLLLLLGVVLIVLSIFTELVMNYSFYHLDLYSYASYSWYLFIMNFGLGSFSVIIFIIYALNNGYFILIPFSLLGAVISVYYSYLIHQDIIHFEYLKNIKEINFYYYLTHANSVLSSIILIYSETKNNNNLVYLGILSFVATVFTLFLGYFNAFFIQNILGYFTPFISLFLIKAYLIELRKTNNMDEVILDR